MSQRRYNRPARGGGRRQGARQQSQYEDYRGQAPWEREAYAPRAANQGEYGSPWGGERGYAPEDEAEYEYGEYGDRRYAGRRYEPAGYPQERFQGGRYQAGGYAPGGYPQGGYQQGGYQQGGNAPYDRPEAGRGGPYESAPWQHAPSGQRNYREEREDRRWEEGRALLGGPPRDWQRQSGGQSGAPWGAGQSPSQWGGRSAPDQYVQYGGAPWGAGEAAYRSTYSSGAGREEFRSANTAPGYGRAADSHYGKGPKQYSRSDERIREDVCDELYDDEEIDAQDIEVQVKDGKVTLIGTVPERAMKHRAEDIAGAARGVRDCENHIRVQSPATMDRSSASDRETTPPRSAKGSAGGV
jgi:hypothetical protein